MTTIQPFLLIDLNESCIELPSERRDFIASLPNQDYSDDILGIKRAMDVSLANAMILAAIKMKQEEIDRELLEKLGHKGFTRYKKQCALEREAHRRHRLKDLHASEHRAQHHPAYLQQYAWLFDLLRGVRTSRLICALEKFAKQAMRWARAYKL